MPRIVYSPHYNISFFGVERRPVQLVKPKSIMSSIESAVQ